jgi:hypothetical protein
MGLLDALFGTQAQAPGATQQPTGLQQLFQPEVAMPVAAALLGNQGNAANFGNAFSAYGQARAQTASKNKTMDFFRQNAPEYAAMVDAGLPLEDAWKSYTQQKYAQKADPFASRAAAAKQFGLDTSTEEGRNFILTGSLPNAKDRFGNQIIWGRDAQGKWHAMQPSSAGGLQEAPGPAGIDLAPPGVSDLNLGTQYLTRDRMGNTIATNPIDNRGKAADTARGTVEGGQIAAAPADIDAAQNALDAIQAIRNDPNKSIGTGFSAIFNGVPGSSGRDFQNRVEGLKSGAFLNGITALRGMGSLSDAEGRAATAAINRMDTSTSEGAFNAALDDYERIVRQGLARARAHLSGQFPAATGGSGSDPLGIRQ